MDLTVFLSDEYSALESEIEDGIDEQAVAWFVRLRADNVSGQDETLFLEWLEQAETHRSAFYEICLLWGDPDFLHCLIGNAKKHGIAPSLKKKRYIEAWRYPVLVAALVVLAVGVARPLRVALKADYSSALGERKTVKLADGSTVMLNTGSAIAVEIAGEQRMVELLQGEAYFDVKPDPNRPFIVRADRSTTRVLGTHFFVDRQTDGDRISVLSGRVEVSEPRRWKEALVLRDREAVTVYDNAIGQPQTMNSALSTSWIDGYLVYENETLENVMRQINRYHAGTVYFKDDDLRQIRINGRLKIRRSREMFDVLRHSMALKMTYLTDWLVIVG